MADFYTYQDRLRKRTRRLVLLFRGGAVATFLAVVWDGRVATEEAEALRGLCDAMESPASTLEIDGSGRK